MCFLADGNEQNGNMWHTQQVTLTFSCKSRTRSAWLFGVPIFRPSTDVVHSSASVFFLTSILIHVGEYNKDDEFSHIATDTHAHICGRCDAWWKRYRDAVLILQFVISAYVVCMAALPEWKT